jgi:hypothetical protein
MMEIIGVSLTQEQKNFYDKFHFSPIKVSVQVDSIVSSIADKGEGGVKMFL